VCQADPDALQSLLDKSLIRRRDGEVGPRYWMLETVREFAAERLAASAEADEMRLAHAQWYAAHVAQLSRTVRDDQPGARAALAADLPNVRAALSLSLSRKDARLSGDCLFGLWHYWLTEGLGREAAAAAHAWLALDRTELEEVARVPGLLASGEIVRFTGDLRWAAELKYEELSIARSHPDENFHGMEMRGSIAGLLSDLAHVELALGNLVQARARADEALSIRRAVGTLPGIGHALLAVGTVALVEGDIERARACFAEGGQAMAGWTDSWEARLRLADCDLLLGYLEAAAHSLRTGVSELRKVRDVSGIADAALVAGRLALERGDGPTAGALTGAFAHILQEAGIPLSHDVHLNRAHSTMIDRLGSTLGEESFERARVRGAQLTEDEVLDLADQVATLDAPVAPSASSDRTTNTGP
jgi:tetratricopeptide (TPR) repeat protein